MSRSSSTDNNRTLGVAIIAAAAGVFFGAIAQMMLVTSVSAADVNRSNNAISVNACIDHGGVPVFTGYNREGEEAMLVQCVVLR